jgi:hypothetical protein
MMKSELSCRSIDDGARHDVRQPLTVRADGPCPLVLAASLVH